MPLWQTRGVSRTAAIALGLAVAACHGASLPLPPLRDGEVGFPDAGPAPELALALHAVVPERGPFTGGNVVVLRASGLRETSWSGACARCEVTFGGAPASSVRFVDEHRLEVVVPPGAAGAVDVRLAQDGAEATLEDGYAYDALAVTPAAGTEGGGTYVTLRSAQPAFGAATEVRFGGAACERVTVEAPDRLTCFTPPGEIGVVDVEARGALTLVAPDAFRYEDPTVDDGGLGGGPLHGTLEVVVLGSGGPLEGATVLAGPAAGALLRATTDARGLAAVGRPTLARGPIDLHVSAPCHSPASMLRFDAARATVWLARDPYDEACALSFEPGPGTLPARVSGDLDVHGWAGVTAGPRERRIVRVTTTRAHRSSAEPAPALDDRWRVVEGDELDGYRISAPSGLVAVVAFAGTEDDTGRFTPVAMGIARGVLLAPGEERTGVHLRVDIPLERSLRVSIGPADGTYHWVSAALRMEEGYLVRRFASERLDDASGSERTFALARQPALAGALAGARFELEVRYADGVGGTSARWLRGVESFDVHVDDFLPIPSCVEPGAEDRFEGFLRWSGGGASDLTRVVLVGGSFDWTAFGPGALEEARFPALGELGLARPSEGALTWAVSRVVLPGLDYDRFRYPQADYERYATHEATCSITARW